MKEIQLTTDSISYNRINIAWEDGRTWKNSWCNIGVRL